MVIALITMLVLFIAALAEGPGSGNREYIQKLNADLIVYQAKLDLNAGASRIGTSKLNEICRVEGVEAVGPIGGLVSVRYSLKVEPLTALGLAQQAAVEKPGFWQKPGFPPRGKNVRT
jgi:hypothetical protein